MMDQRRVKAVFDGDACAVVGNHKTMEQVGDAILCRFHGHPIVLVTETSIVFDPCDLHNGQTGRAMTEFAAAFGLDIKVSFAKGDFNIYRGSTRCRPDWNGVITIHI